MTKRNKAQVTIWIIIAMLIVFGIIILFLLRIKPSISITGSELNPESYIEKCTVEYAKEALDKMLPQGGFINPENFKLYNNTKISYLCENTGNYRPCVNQHPMFLDEMKKETENYIIPKMEQCFQNLKRDFEEKNYDVQMGKMNLDVEFAPRKVFVSINRKLSIAKSEQTRNFEDFNSDFPYPVYDIAKVAIEIANQEATYCYFEYVGYMILYPQIDIRKTQTSDSIKIYTIMDRKSQKKMNIAIRSCAIPAGI